MLSQCACPPNNMTNWLGFIFNFNLLKKVGYQNGKKKKKKRKVQSAYFQEKYKSWRLMTLYLLKMKIQVQSTKRYRMGIH